MKQTGYAAGVIAGYNKAKMEMKEVELQNELITPAIYSSIAIALKNKCDFDYDKIQEIFIESQEIWTSFNDNLNGMINKCYDETGILLIDESKREDYEV